MEEEEIVGAEERRKGSEVRQDCSQQEGGKLGRVQQQSSHRGRVIAKHIIIGGK